MKTEHKSYYKNGSIRNIYYTLNSRQHGLDTYFLEDGTIESKINFYLGHIKGLFERDPFTNYYRMEFYF